MATTQNVNQGDERLENVEEALSKTEQLYALQIIQY